MVLRSAINFLKIPAKNKKALVETKAGAVQFLILNYCEVKLWNVFINIFYCFSLVKLPMWAKYAATARA